MAEPVAMTTDYVESTGDPEPYLRAIADAGFGSVHWCHQWCTDFLYGEAEIAEIARVLDEYGLAVNDLHGSAGKEKVWSSAVEYQRAAGVELVRNRIDMARRLDCDVVIMHYPAEPDDEGDAARQPYWDRFRRTMDELRPFAAERGVRIAVENGYFDTIEKMLSLYGPDYLGLCYDSGHGNCIPDGLDRLAAVKDRLISLHLDDNDGSGDQHMPIFGATVDWERLAAVIAASGYSRPVMTMEVVTREAGIEDEGEFLRHCLEGGRRFAAMVEAARSAAGA